MIETLNNLPEHVLGFRAVGEVSAQDYEEQIIPAVLAMAERLHHVRMLYVIDEAFTGFTAGAMLDDAMLGASRYAAWERVAVVTDVPWIRASVQALHFLMPGHFRLFHTQERQQAEHWLSESRTNA